MLKEHMLFLDSCKARSMLKVLTFIVVGRGPQYPIRFIIQDNVLINDCDPGVQIN